MRTDPRIRQSLNRISDNVESATETACVGCFTFSKTYLEPLWNSISDGCAQLCSCLPEESQRLVGGQGRNAGRGRGRGGSEYPFDFYNDDNWYDDYYGTGESANGFLGSWGNDELDRLLAGNGPRRNEEMYYGIGGGSGAHHGGGGSSTNGALGLFAGRRRRSAVQPHDGGPDPTVIPNTSMLGFLTRWPFWRSTLRYRPSAADLQEHPGMPRDFAHPADDGSDSGDASDRSRARQGRKRSSTEGSGRSGDSGDSFRSRGDLFPSDGEEDAVPIGDEFSIVLRGSGSDGEASSSKFKGDSMMSSSPKNVGILSNSGDGRYTSIGDPAADTAVLSDEEMRKQEEDVTAHEEREIERKRAAAQQLAFQRGLSVESSESAAAHDALSPSSPAPALERTQSLPATHIPRSPVIPYSVPRSPVSAIYIPSAVRAVSPQRGAAPSSPHITAPIPIPPIHSILRENVDTSESDAEQNPAEQPPAVGDVLTAVAQSPSSVPESISTVVSSKELTSGSGEPAIFLINAAPQSRPDEEELFCRRTAHLTVGNSAETQLTVSPEPPSSTSPIASTMNPSLSPTVLPLRKQEEQKQFPTIAIDIPSIANQVSSHINLIKSFSESALESLPKSLPRWIQNPLTSGLVQSSNPLVQQVQMDSRNDSDDKTGESGDEDESISSTNESEQQEQQKKRRKSEAQQKASPKVQLPRVILPQPSPLLAEASPSPIRSTASTPGLRSSNSPALGTGIGLGILNWNRSRLGELFTSSDDEKNAACHVPCSTLETIRTENETTKKNTSSSPLLSSPALPFLLSPRNSPVNTISIPKIKKRSSILHGQNHHSWSEDGLGSGHLARLRIFGVGGDAGIGEEERVISRWKRSISCENLVAEYESLQYVHDGDDDDDGENDDNDDTSIDL